MASVNKIIVVGNVGRDAEFKETSGGGLLKFSVATTEKYKDKEDTQWHNVVIFGKLAEAIKDYVVKGRQIYVEGQMKYDKWEDKDGNKRTSSFISVGFGGTVMLLGKSDARSTTTTTVETSSGPVSVSDDEVPF